MTFLTWPIAALAAAVLVPALIVLYFLKLRRRDVEVSSTLLWKKAIQDLQANAPFQKLRNNILLILQLLALLIALLAIAQPEFASSALQEQRQIILIDRSASMSTTDGDAGPSAPSSAEASAPSGLTRLDAAKRTARAIVDRLKEPGIFEDRQKAAEVMIIVFDSGAEVRQVFTSNKALLRSAIDSIQPTQTPSSLAQAFELARVYTGTRKFEDQIVEGDLDPATGKRSAIGFVPSGPGATLHVISDGRLPDADKVQSAPEDRVEYHPVGSPTTINVGITGLRAQRSFDTPSRVDIFVAVQSTDPAPRVVDVELLVDGALQKVTDVKLTAASTATPVATDADAATIQAQRPRPGLGGFVLPFQRSQAGVAQIRLIPRGDDGLSADNTAYVTIPPVRRLNIALISNGSLFVQRALEGLKPSKLDLLTPAAFQSLLDKGSAGGDGPTGGIAQYDVMVFDRFLPMVKVDVLTPPTPTTPAPAAGQTATKPPTPTSTRRPGLPPGRSLVLGAVPPPPLGVIDRGEGEATVIYDYVRDHPALRLSGLDKVNIGKSRKVELAPDTPVRVIARDSGGPAILEISDSVTTALVVPFDVDDTDWPFSAEWVLFLAGSILHLSEANVGQISDGVRAGETLLTRVPFGTAAVSLLTPDQQTFELTPAPDGTVSFAPIAQTGIYALSWDGPGGAADTTVGNPPRTTRRIAANLLDPFESDIGAVPTLAIANAEVQAAPEREGNLVRRLWPWILLAALAIIMLEWFVYNRKVAI